MNTTCNKKLLQNTFIYSQARISLVPRLCPVFCTQALESWVQPGNKARNEASMSTPRECNTCALINTLAIYISKT